VVLPSDPEQPAADQHQPADVPSETEVAPVESDEVLSGWGQETWWDAPAAQPALALETKPAQPAESSREESKGASVGLLGALFGLVSLRRRRREEDGSV
jgi:hypothetical protein